MKAIQAAARILGSYSKLFSSLINALDSLLTSFSILYILYNSFPSLQLVFKFNFIWYLALGVLQFLGDKMSSLLLGLLLFELVSLVMGMPSMESSLKTIPYAV